MLDTLITSRTRIKLLIKFFLNSSTRSYLRDLEGEFDESTNAIRIELNRFEKAGLLSSSSEGNKKIFRANTAHPLFKDIHNILLKSTGIDQVIDQVVNRLGGLHQAWLIGDFAKGKDSSKIEIILVGDNIDIPYLSSLINKAENITSRKIEFMIVDELDQNNQINQYKEALLIWENNN
jgi:hypothetical protein